MWRPQLWARPWSCSLLAMPVLLWSTPTREPLLHRHAMHESSCERLNPNCGSPTVRNAMATPPRNSHKRRQCNSRFETQWGAGRCLLTITYTEGHHATQSGFSTYELYSCCPCTVSQSTCELYSCCPRTVSQSQLAPLQHCMSYEINLDQSAMLNSQQS